MTQTCLRSVNASCNVPSLKPGTGSELANTTKKTQELTLTSTLSLFIQKLYERILPQN